MAWIYIFAYVALCHAACLFYLFIGFNFFNQFIFSWRIIALQYLLVSTIYQHESAIGIHVSPPSWNSSHLLPRPTPLGCRRAPDLSSLCHTWNVRWLSNFHMIICMFQCYSLNLSRPLLTPLCPQVFSLRLCPHCSLQYLLNTFLSLQFYLSICMPRNGISGSYGNSVFSFLRELHNVFHNDCTNLHSHSSIRGFPFLHALSNICYL